MMINRPYVQPVCQICAKDTIEIAINLYSMQGLVDIDSIEWLEPDIQPTPKDNVLNYNKDTTKMRTNMLWGGSNNQNDGHNKSSKA